MFGNLMPEQHPSQACRDDHWQFKLSAVRICIIRRRVTMPAGLCSPYLSESLNCTVHRITGSAT